MFINKTKSSLAHQLNCVCNFTCVDTQSLENRTFVGIT